MGGARAHAAEIVGRFDEAATEVILPDAIDEAAPGQWMARISQPEGERFAASAFAGVAGKIESRRQTGDCRKRARADFLALVAEITASQDMNRARFAAIGSGAAKRAGAVMNASYISQFRFWHRGEIGSD